MTICFVHSCHGDDMPYTFDVPNTSFTADGRYISQTLIEYWSNFAKTNNPKTSKEITWPSYNSKSAQFLRFKKPENKIESHYLTYLTQECNVFDKIGYYDY